MFIILINALESEKYRRRLLKRFDKNMKIKDMNALKVK